MFESVWISVLCTALYGGVPEQSIRFTHNDRSDIVRADCVTPTHVIEVGRDTSDGLRDSITQAVFNASRLGLLPLVVIVDSDGQVGSQEFQVMETGRLLRVEVQRIGTEVLLRSQMQATRSLSDDTPGL